MTGTKGRLRSADWFDAEPKTSFIHRSWMRIEGVPDHAFDGRPVIGICNTWSELTPCNAHFRDLAEMVKRGVLEAGGVPLEFPVMSLGEAIMRPTTMLFRNLVSMDVEESIRANPLDGVVLLAGCDKTTPSTLMGAVSCDLPTLVVSGGPMLNGKFRGRDIGSGTDVWRFSEELRAGRMTEHEFAEAEACMSRSAGHCMTMGTASTMACMVEALGLTLPGGAAIPAADSRRKSLAQLAGNRIVEMVREDLRLSRILGRPAFENAIRVNAAIGGSTNFVVHLLGPGRPRRGRAVAGRLRRPRQPPAPARRPDALGPLFDGGLLLRRGPAGGDPRAGAAAAHGRPHRQRPHPGRQHRRRPLPRPGGDPALRRARAGGGPASPCCAATWPRRGRSSSPRRRRRSCCKHRGRAVVFEDIEDLQARIDDPDLEVDESCVLVLKGAGPKGYPGMAEVGNLPMPKKLVEAGVRDMVRISDGRMSGTAYGTVVLHTSPESAVGGTLALVRNGDEIELDVRGRRPAPARRRRGAEPAARRLDPAAAPRHSGLRPPLRGARAAGASGGGLRLPARRLGGRGPAGGPN